MQRKGRRRNYGDIVQPAHGGERRRSLEVPLLWLGVAAFAGFPMLRDATSDPMQRNRYGNDLHSCECDYGQDRCSFQNGGWVGPWYARDAKDRKPDDPGRGACRERQGGHGGSHGYRGSTLVSQDDGYRTPSGVERGYRGGFGGTGRVRAAGS